MLGAGVALFFAIRWFGETLEAPPPAASATSPATASQGVPPLPTTRVDVVLHVLATLSAIIALGYLIGRALRYFGQPPVIGEVLAGLVLGPSLLGTLWPSAAHFLVPTPDVDPAGKVLSALEAISQLGIVLYLFLVGLELNLSQLRRQAHAAVAISHASILVPFLLGAALSLWLYPRVSTADVTFTSLSLFMGVAMAITAFPVLARILTDRGLEKTDLGVMALSCAATDDVTAWCLLALVIGMAQAHVSDTLWVLAGAALYVAVMFVVVRPVAGRVAHRFEHGELPSWTLPGVLVAVMISALATQWIGIHALFGGFVMGVIMSHDSRLAAELKDKLYAIATVLLLPAFFAVTGLRTQLTLLDHAGDWVLTGVIILVATLGKVGGTVVAARFTGIDWRTAGALGVLMNTRGLMELVALNIGLEIGVISPRLFAMMVLMALATTLATAPALRRFIPQRVPEVR
jgi:Kef-type K+ transport system membrane component KefB